MNEEHINELPIDEQTLNTIEHDGIEHPVGLADPGSEITVTTASTDKPKGKIIKTRVNKDGTIDLQMNVVEKEAQCEVVTLPNGMMVPIPMSSAERKALEAEVRRAIKKNQPVRLAEANKRYVKSTNRRNRKSKR